MTDITLEILPTTERIRNLIVKQLTVNRWEKKLSENQINNYLKKSFLAIENLVLKIATEYPIYNDDEESPYDSCFVNDIPNI